MAFGHLRLAIVDLTDTSAQPMLTEDGSGALVYNGEVYNYRELRKELARPQMKRRADRYGVTKWLLSGGQNPERTLFEGIDTVKAGSLWKVTPQGIEP